MTIFLVLVSFKLYFKDIYTVFFPKYMTIKKVKCIYEQLWPFF